MDAISYSLAAKQAQRIKKFVAEPDAASGLVTVPSVIASGDTVSIPAGRTLVHPNLQVDGTLAIDGTLFIPSGGTYTADEVDVTVVKQNGSVVAIDSAVVHKTGDETIAGVKTFSSSTILNGNVGIGTSSPVARLHNVSSASSGGAPATSGLTDANIGQRFQTGSVALDFGHYSNGEAWIQNRLFNSYSNNYTIHLNPNGGNVNIGGSLTVNGSPLSVLTGGQTGTAPLYGARAWVNFNGTGTVAIRASGNVSSITDNGVGNYTVNFTIAMPDDKYSCVGGVRVAGSTVDGVSANASVFELTSLSVSSVGVGAFNYNNIAVDRDNFTCSVFR